MFALTKLLKRSLGAVALFIGFAVPAHINSTVADTNAFVEGGIAFKDGDLKHAIQRWSVAAENGDPFAQYNLGLMNRDGIGLPKNHATALNWFSKASKNGNPMASVQMAKMFELGDGVPKNYQMAVVLFHVGAATLPDGACRESINERIDTLAVHLAGADLVSAIREAKQSSDSTPKSPRLRWTNKFCLSMVMLPEPTPEPNPDDPDKQIALAAKDASVSSSPPDELSSDAARVDAARVDAAPSRDEFFIQLASYLERQRALAEQSGFIRRHEDILSPLSASIVEGQSVELGTVFRVRFGPFENKAAAAAACDAIKKRKEACIVYQGRPQANATRDADLTDG